MNEGWLWDSILKTAHRPSPMSTTPAFSPGPWTTRGPLVGRVFRWIRLLLYEQCSDHITEKSPSSVRLGSRPRWVRIRSYSSAVSPCRARSSAVGVMRTAILSRRAAAVRVELPEPEVHPFDVRGAVVVASDKGHELELGVAGVAQEAVGDLVQREQAVRGADHEVGWEL